MYTRLMSLSAAAERISRRHWNAACKRQPRRGAPCSSSTARYSKTRLVSVCYAVQMAPDHYSASPATSRPATGRDPKRPRALKLMALKVHQREGSQWESARLSGASLVASRYEGFKLRGQWWRRKRWLEMQRWPGQDKLAWQRNHDEVCMRGGKFNAASRRRARALLAPALT
ncbi:hypothetical protein V7S43_018764 [Phytophthora oleae]|uniref:Uncharacterized protein n=1 Tax=Phytophthora oleae TaxID=2107226 RepID=A0ABD3EQ55_9STRA